MSDPHGRPPTGSSPRLSVGDTGKWSSVSVADLDPDDLSIPPPPPPPASSPGGSRETPPDLHDHVRQARRESRVALRTSQTAIGLAQEIKTDVGHSPDPARNLPGSGLFGVVSQLVTEVRAEREERAKRLKALVDIAKGVAIGAGALSAIFGILSKVFHW